MDGFDAMFRHATASVPPDYFQLPVAGGAPVYRERVYCYELYHQLRTCLPAGSPYRLNGEVDKRGHALFETEAWAPKPDFLVHIPGTNDNYAVIEVKSAERLRSEGPRKDLNTLGGFRRVAGYTRMIFLVFGDIPDEIVSLFQRSGVSQDQLAEIELWGHAAAGVPAERLTLLRT